MHKRLSAMTGWSLSPYCFKNFYGTYDFSAERTVNLPEFLNSPDFSFGSFLLIKQKKRTYQKTQTEQTNPNLQIKCNTYDNNRYDWTVTSGALADQGMCHGSDPATPAGNVFH